MLLSEHNICYYLMDKGLLDNRSILDGEFSARRSDSRNNNFVINREFGHHNYFIKQVRANEQEKIETLLTEATCYRLANNDEKYASLLGFLPKNHLYDAQNHILVTEGIGKSISLHEYFLNTDTPDRSISRRLAKLLASFHSNSNESGNEENMFKEFRKQLPWVFDLGQNKGKRLADPGEHAEAQALYLISQNPEFPELIGKQKQLWEASSLVHNDAKFSNYLVNDDAAEKGIQFLKLIDWELADWGDPLWDVATIIQNYLLLWITFDQPVSQIPAGLTQRSLNEVQLMIRDFWEAYCAERQPDDRRVWLEKVTGFTALKLIHSCFEFIQPDIPLQPISAKLLQIGFNVLQNPLQASRELFGIES